MPQLNPAPWLSLMIFTWLVFLIIIPPKVLAHFSPNNALMQDMNDLKTESWTWPWS
uniref:ATP synthase complex subunit 8 n=1 Tax=Nothobranchius thierryi TaxID=60304 RepID=A0A518LY72_9TELE|nr:ATP synthase F0 subunit 8 [Nothobranchius thierryi]QDW10531.1 ATP synthase F0 subunit 8 [Nothobranchius thierryi]